MLRAYAYEGCGVGTTNGSSQPTMELAERNHEHTAYLFGPGLLMETRLSLFMMIMMMMI